MAGQGRVRNPETDRRLNRTEAVREQTAFKLPVELMTTFRRETKRAGVTMTSVVEAGIREWINRQRRLA